MEFKDKRLIFHMLAASFLTGKTYIDYCKELNDALPTHSSKTGLPIKGNKSLKAFTIDCKVKVQKHMDQLEEYLMRVPETFELSMQEIDRIESVMSSLLMLSPQGQIRVKGLIEKIKNDQYEIDYWIEFNKEQENES